MEPRDDPRPLTARSVVASTLLGVRPPRLPVRVLVASAARFGIAEGTVRTALSRMVTAGELTGDGRAYELAGPFLTRQARQDESRAGAPSGWSGEWELAVVDAERRAAADRAELRAAMRALRLAELRAGVWLRPDNLDPARLPDARAVVAAQCRTLRSRPDDDPTELAARLWDLEGWAATAERLVADLATSEARLAGGDPEALAPGFVLSASVLRHFQADPLLPQTLLPDRWPGPGLRAAYEAYDATFQGAWRAGIAA
jgi:phenylacetic acid degradation operon negative regulatory protein